MVERSSNYEGSAAMSRRRWLIIGVVLFLVIAMGLLSWWWLRGTANKYDPSPGIRVEQEIPDVPTGLKVGVVVSYTEDTAEGAGWDGNGEGITLAKWRLAQAGTAVDTMVVSDQGSAEGAASAVKELAGANVSAIIALTQGNHTGELAKAALGEGLPIIFPYQESPENPIDGAWYGFEPQASFNHALAERLSEVGCSPLVSVGPAPDGLRVDSSVTGDDKENQVAGLLDESNHGCVLVNGPAKQMATQVQQLRAKGISVPIVVGLAGANADFVKSVSSTNPDAGSIYMYATPTLYQGSAWIGFDQARTLAATTDNVESLREDTSFTQRASLADASSYEAFMSVVDASSRARSTDPSAIKGELAKVRISASDAVDGVERDFSSPVYQQPRLIRLVPVGSTWQWVDSK